MARENPIDQVEQAGATERCVVRLAAARGHVHPVPGRSEPLDRGASIRVARVDMRHRLPFEFPRDRKGIGGPSGYADTLAVSREFEREAMSHVNARDRK